MARKKKSEQNGEATEAEVGHNSRKELTPEERQALHYVHVRDYRQALAVKKAADATLKNVCKTIKSDGGSVRKVKLTIQLETPEGEAALRAEMAEMQEAAVWSGVGIQVDMFSDERQPAEDRAFDEGKRAGMKGEPRTCQYDSTLPQFAKWQDGYTAGNAVLASEGFKRLTPIEQAAT